VPTAPTPTTNKSAWGQRADQGSGVPGAQLDKTLRHLDRRRDPAHLDRRHFIGPIAAPRVPIPLSERRG
jgi:hypothetical protein